MTPRTKQFFGWASVLLGAVAAQAAFLPLRWQILPTRWAVALLTTLLLTSAILYFLAWRSAGSDRDHRSGAGAGSARGFGRVALFFLLGALAQVLLSVLLIVLMLLVPWLDGSGPGAYK